MKITKEQLKTLIQEEYALVKSQIPQQEDEYFEYPDEEGKMAKRQLESIIECSQQLMSMLGDKTQLESWVQSKITKAEDYISTVKHYLEYEMGHMPSSQPNPYDMNPEKAHMYKEDDEQR